jgi:hypothetical protein
VPGYTLKQARATSVPSWFTHSQSSSHVSPQKCIHCHDCVMIIMWTAVFSFLVPVINMKFWDLAIFTRVLAAIRLWGIWGICFLNNNININTYHKSVYLRNLILVKYSNSAFHNFFLAWVLLFLICSVWEPAVFCFFKMAVTLEICHADLETVFQMRQK